MSEIIKLYENVGIKKRLLCGDRDVLCGHVRPDGKSRLAFGCFGCEYKNDAYPPFTAEKQLELIKLIVICKKETPIRISCKENLKGINHFFVRNRFFGGRYCETLSESIATFINELYEQKELTMYEKKEIRNILNEG